MFRRALSTTRTVLNEAAAASEEAVKTYACTKPVPKPTEAVPDVDTFLAKIGREASEHSGVFENDWKKFFTMPSYVMKAEGMDTKSRKYISYWQEKFRQGAQLEPLKQSVKKHGGERNARIYAAEKKVKDRIKAAQAKKQYTKARTAELIQEKRWDKMHREA